MAVSKFSSDQPMYIQKAKWTFPNLLVSLCSLKSQGEASLESAAKDPQGVRPLRLEAKHFQAWLCCCPSQGPSMNLSTSSVVISQLPQLNQTISQVSYLLQPSVIRSRKYGSDYWPQSSRGSGDHVHAVLKLVIPVLK